MRPTLGSKDRPQPPRVAVVSSLPISAPSIASRLVPLSDGLRAKGINVEMFFLQISQAGTNICGKLSWIAGLARLIIQFAYSLRRTDIVLVQKPGFFSVLVIYPLLRLLRLPLAIDIDDLERGKDIFMRAVVKRVPLVIVASKFLYNHCLKFGCSPAQLVLIPNSATTIDNLVWPRQETTVCTQRVVWSGFLYDHIDLIPALEAIRADSSHMTQLTVIGGGPALTKLQARVHSLGLESRVALTGMLTHDECIARMRNCDVGLILLRDSDFDRAKSPIKLYEYMMLGLPVITSKVGEPAEVVARCGCGVIVDGSPDSILAAFQQLAADPITRRAMGEKGRHYLTQCQNWSIGSELLFRRILSTYVSSCTQAGSSTE